MVWTSVLAKEQNWPKEYTAVRVPSDHKHGLKPADSSTASEMRRKVMIWAGESAQTHLAYARHRHCPQWPGQPGPAQQQSETSLEHEKRITNRLTSGVTTYSFGYVLFAAVGEMRDELLLLMSR